MTAIQAERLSKTYREGHIQVAAVREATLSVGAGEIVAIVGPSGSGKTTLLSMLGGILRPTEGEVVLHGRRLRDLDERRLPSLRLRLVGFIFQSFNLFAALTARENVEVVLNLKGLRGQPARRAAMDLLSAMGLEERANFLPRDLSGGEKQRVSIARALAGNPPVILADEPTANLDWRNGEQVIHLLRDATRSDRRSVVVVTHDQRLLPFVDRTLAIEDGRLRG